MNPRYLIFLLGAILSTFPCPGDSQRPILTFGQTCPLSGTSQQAGTDIKNGINAAFAQINNANTLNVSLQLITLDDGYVPSVALSNAQQLVSQNVFGMAGVYGAAIATTLVPYLSSLGIPLIGPYTGSNVTRTPFDPNNINIRASYDDETAAMINFLVSERLLSKIAIVYQNDSYGLSGLSGVTRALKAINLVPYVTATYPRNTVNVAQAVSFVSQAAPEAIILIAVYAPAAAFVNQYRALPSTNPNTIYMAPSLVTPDTFIQMINTAPSNIFVSQVLPIPTNNGSSMVANYQQALQNYNSSLQPSYTSLEGYVIGRFIGTVLQRMEMNVTRAKFKDVVFLSSIFRIDDFFLGPYYYNSIYNPLAIPQEQAGCNQGVRTIYITSFDQSIGQFVQSTAPFTFYSTCASDTSAISYPVVFGSISDDPSITNRFVKGANLAFSSSNATGTIQNIKLRLLSIDIPDSNNLNSIVSMIPWHDNMIGYIGNQGSINSNQDFINFETGLQKIFIEPQTGDPNVRNPFNSLIMNIRAAFADEIYALVYYLLGQNLNRISLVTDGSTEGMVAYNVLSGELLANGMTLVQQAVTSNYQSIPALLSAILPNNNQPDAIFLVGQTSSIQSLSTMLAGKNVLRVYTSLNTLQDIISMSNNATSTTLFSSPLPLVEKVSSYSLVSSFRSDYTTAYPASSNTDLSDVVIFDGYITGLFISNVISRMTSTISGMSISEQITSVRSYDIGGMKLGPFSNLPCTDSMVDQVFGCECNQGAHNVYLYSLYWNGNAFLPLDKEDYYFDTCGVALSDVTLSWDDLTNPGNLALFVLIMISMGLTVVSIIFVFVNRNNSNIATTSPVFLTTILVGIVLGYLSIFPFIGEPSSSKCAAQPWVPGLAWAVVLSHLIAKNYRIHRIAATDSPDTSKLKDIEILKISMPLVLIEVILLLIWTVAEPPTVFLDIPQKWVYCVSGNPMRDVVIAYNVLLVAATTYLSIKTREAYERFPDSRLLGFASYNLLFMGVILLGLVMSSTPQMRFVLIAAMILLLATPSLLILIGVKVYRIAKKLDVKDKVRSKTVSKFTSSASKAKEESGSQLGGAKV